MTSETQSAGPARGESNVRVRFAPAPTGYLHLGSARTALFNWLFARHHGGTFILRIEDTDLERSRRDVIEQVLESMRWLGLDWDEGPDANGDFGPYLQSERIDLHLEHARKLLDASQAYECYMTPEELEQRRRAAIDAGKPFRYEGWHRDLTDADRERFRAEGRKPAIRLRVEHADKPFVVHDLVKGKTEFPPEQIDDFVLVRSDGTPSFHLANVVDDALMKITHIIRGEDHLTNTIRHQVLFDMLGYPRPEYAHLPMILGPDRTKLSKRHGAVSVMEYRERGYLPEALVNVLALLGWSSPDGQERLSRDDLVTRFDLDRVGRSASIFDFAKTAHFNGLLIREMSVDELREKLDPYFKDVRGLPEGKELQLAALLQKELTLLSDLPKVAQPIFDQPEWTDEVLRDEGMARAADVLEELIPRFETIGDDFTPNMIKQAIKEAGKAVGVKGKQLFFPVRAALTGQLHGPQLDGIIELLGPQETTGRMARLLGKLQTEAR